MRLLLAAVALLSLLCVGHSAPMPNCENLIQKIDIESRDVLLGRWIYAAESTTIPGTAMLTKLLIDSVIVHAIPLVDNNSVQFTQIQRMFGRCASFSSTLTVVNNTMQMIKPYVASEVLLTTSCPDCLVILGNFTLGSRYFQSLQLLSKRRVLSTAELEEFKKQAECLNLPAPHALDPQKELCPEQQTSGTTDLTSEVDAKVIGVLDSVISSPGGLEGFFNKLLGKRH
ncbi:hypothetical protein WMY93_006406 [Mugilogobius chulae]|uniref:Apolipoprotein M n=1 Tax=Mugilogobius chulae TaxID=88201 RepID=A0AAW0PW87_9GOBI